jgi:tetratricopeptide (TPR) repeat protein
MPELRLKGDSADPVQRPAASTLAAEAWTFAERGELHHALNLAQKAVELDPECVEALRLLGEIFTTDRDERLDLLGRAVDAARRELGAALFTENDGRFLERPEAMPFLRASVALAEAMRIDRRQAVRFAALDRYLELLRLQPNDEFGCRAPFVSLLLSFGLIDEAAAVIEHYADDRLLSMRWLATLVEYAIGDRAKAERLARDADAFNRHVIPLACGLQKLPREPRAKPSRVPHDPIEAEEAARLLHPVLKATSGGRNRTHTGELAGVLDWLLVQFVEAGGSDRSSRAGYVVMKLPTSRRPPDAIMRAFLGEGKFPAPARRRLAETNATGSRTARSTREQRDRQRDAAQELAYDAMERYGCGRLEAACDRCREAIDVFPDCVDARLLLAQLEIREVDAFRAAVEEACEAGRRDLGPSFMKKNVGHFWGLIETRPYMRALAALAESLRTDPSRRERERALPIYAELLRLNPNDNQGVREPYASLLLVLGQAEEARILLERYAEDDSLTMNWLRVATRFATVRMQVAESLAIRSALNNRHVLPLALGIERLPTRLAGGYTLGIDSPSEGRHAASLLEPVVRSMPDLKAWLLDLHAAMPGKRVDRAKAPPIVPKASRPAGSRTRGRPRFGPE